MQDTKIFISLATVCYLCQPSYISSLFSLKLQRNWEDFGQILLKRKVMFYRITFGYAKVFHTQRMGKLLTDSSSSSAILNAGDTRRFQLGAILQCRIWSNPKKIAPNEIFIDWLIGVIGIPMDHLVENQYMKQKFYSSRTILRLLPG